METIIGDYDEYACKTVRRRAGTVSGRFAEIARSVQAHLNASKGKAIPLNIDEATAVTYTELGLAGPLARGLFCLSRSVGIVAHAWEQMEQGGRTTNGLQLRTTVGQNTGDNSLNSRQT